MTAHISTVREEFKTLETVQEHRTYIRIPVILDGNTLPNLPSESLRPLFDRQRACLLIVAQGGSGKTSSACQIALWAIKETPQHRIAPHLTHSHKNAIIPRVLALKMRSPLYRHRMRTNLCIIWNPTCVCCKLLGLVKKTCGLLWTRWRNI
ncbi:hypothetical protein [Laspinema palackyanum]|uniref:hypothetical protein n=1 Tax=Laspinema palackyanum TaxID=3231601 RepID=UPI00345D0FCD|nr:hypothetical protein [Laspinema sp. D2c]